MSPWAESLGPVVITGFALQQLLELIDPLLERYFKANKALIHNLIAFGCALFISVFLRLRALRPFGVEHVPWLDLLITALLVTGGTRWVNDLVKIMRYKKQEIYLRTSQAEHGA
jgi:hypothetical protein